MEAHYRAQVTLLDQHLYRLQGVYRDPFRLRNDAIELLRRYSGLQPRCAAPEPGKQAIVSFAGTIPVQYRGVVYHIPVTLWATEAYPYRAPLAYVTPTAAMAIKPKHKHVDSKGLVYLPYITAWSATSSSLQGLAANMCTAFSSDPPVRAKPTGAAAAAATTSSSASSSSASSKPASSGAKPPSYRSAATAAPLSSSVARGSSSSSSAASASVAAAAVAAFEDPGAVIKRNAIEKVSEKLRAELLRVYAETGREIEALMANDASSADAATRKRSELRTLDAEATAYRSKADELRKWLGANDADAIDIDAITEPRDPLSQQLLHLAAADAALADTMYYLEKALANASVDLDQFLKLYRALAREQCIKRATMKAVHARQRELKAAAAAAAQ